MASSLTSTNLKSSSLYLLLLALVVVGVFYLFFFRKPDVTVGLQQHAFRLNAAAFTNGIYLANIRFITNNAERKTTDIWGEKETGLDFNRFGYPIGTNVLDVSQETPTSAEQCRQVWMFVLGPLQPKISLSSDSESYWVELDNSNNCIFRAFNLEKMQLSYQSRTGKVVLFQ